MPPPQHVQVTFDGDPATVTVAGTSWSSWLQITEASRTAGTLDLALQPWDTASAGTRTLTLRVGTTRNGGQQTTVDVTVGYTVFTRFGASSGTIAFTAVGGSPQPAQPGSGGTAITVAGTGARWEAVPADAWVHVTPGSGTGPGTVTVSVDPAGLSAGAHPSSVTVSDAASYPATIVLAYANADGAAQTLTVPVSLGACLPHVDNQLGVSLSSAAVVALPAPALAYQAVAAPSTREKLLYDAERETLYAVNATDQSIERYARSGGTWSALAPIVVPAVRDVDLSPDGKALLVVTKGALGDIDLAGGSTAFVQRAANPDTFCGGYFAQLAVANSGKAVVVFKLGACSGFSQSYLYDLRDHSLSGGGAVVSRDGAKAFVYRDDGTAGARIEVYDLDGALVTGALYPLAKTVPLRDAANGATGRRVQLAVTPDGSAVFVSGDARVLVVPVS